METETRAQEMMRMHRRSCFCSSPPSSVCATSLHARHCSVLRTRGRTARRTGPDGVADDVEECRSGQQGMRDNADALSLVHLLSASVRCVRNELLGSLLLGSEGVSRHEEAVVLEVEWRRAGSRARRTTPMCHPSCKWFPSLPFIVAKNLQACCCCATRVQTRTEWWRWSAEVAAVELVTSSVSSMHSHITTARLTDASEGGVAILPDASLLLALYFRYL